MPEKVSVLFAVPTNGNADVIDTTRRSIVSQTYPQSLLEISEVQYVASAPGGHAAAINAARESATGLFVVQAEPGVIWDHHKLERQVSFLEEHAHLAGAPLGEGRGGGGRRHRLGRAPDRGRERGTEI